jgi:hypothetical protein
MADARITCIVKPNPQSPQSPQSPHEHITHCVLRMHDDCRVYVRRDRARVAATS